MESENLKHLSHEKKNRITKPLESPPEKYQL